MSRPITWNLVICVKQCNPVTTALLSEQAARDLFHQLSTHGEGMRIELWKHTDSYDQMLQACNENQKTNPEQNPPHSTPD